MTRLDYLSTGYKTIDVRLIPRTTHVYWLCDNETYRIIKVGITRNPYLIAAKIPEGTYLNLFPCEDKQIAEILANNMICDLSIEQRLFNVYTIRQANYRIRKVDKRATINDAIEFWNDSMGDDQHLLKYAGEGWINKSIVDDFVSMTEYRNTH